MQEIELKPVIVGDKRTVNPKHLIMGKIEDKEQKLWIIFVWTKQNWQKS